jgi:hypothetical protein
MAACRCLDIAMKIAPWLDPSVLFFRLNRAARNPWLPSALRHSYSWKAYTAKRPVWQSARRGFFAFQAHDRAVLDAQTRAQ